MSIARNFVGILWIRVILLLRWRIALRRRIPLVLCRIVLFIPLRWRTLGRCVLPLLWRWVVIVVRCHDWRERGLVRAVDELSD